MDKESKKTLLRIEKNDDTFTNLVIGDITYNNGDYGDSNNNRGRFMSSFTDNFSRLCTGIKGNTHITKLEVNLISFRSCIEEIDSGGLYDGLKRNPSINELIIRGDGGPISSEGCRILEAYQSNSNLTDFSIFCADLPVGRGDEIITTTLQCCTNLRTINLKSCSISASMVLPMVAAMRGLRSLEQLFLNNNNVGNAGCEAIATLLKDPNCNIHTIELRSNNIGNEGTVSLVNSLVNNTKLRNLDLSLRNQIILDSVWRQLLNVICNTSSINDTYSSNHTLQMVRVANLELDNALLRLHKCTNKSHVAIKKIIKYHPNIDMTPLFGWDKDGEWTLPADHAKTDKKKRKRSEE